MDLLDFFVLEIFLARLNCICLNFHRLILILFLEKATFTFIFYSFMIIFINIL